MGKYINQTSSGEILPPSGKSEVIVMDGGRIIPQPADFIENLVCVVDNFAFEAAAYCYNEREFLDFTSPADYRKKTWLIYDKAKDLAN